MGHILGNIGYTGQFGNNGDICHMGDIGYFGLQNGLACHSHDTVPLHGVINSTHPQERDRVTVNFRGHFTVIWSTYAFVTKGEGVMLRCDDVLAHSL